ncbi:MAG: trigger factor, partial [Motiliproteus sp.]|nr:trigger factor [Motiliproteus sp.]
GLLVNEVIDSGELKTDQDRVDSTLEEMAGTYEQPQEVIEYYKSNPEQLAQIEALVLEDQVVESLVGQAKVSEVAVSYEEALKPAQPQSAEETAEDEAEAAEEKSAE